MAAVLLMVCRTPQYPVRMQARQRAEKRGEMPAFPACGAKNSGSAGQYSRHAAQRISVPISVSIVRGLPNTLMPPFGWI